MTLFESPPAAAPGSGAERAVWQLAVPVLAVEAAVTCAEVDRMLRADGGWEHTSLVVHDRGGRSSRGGFLSRRRFEQEMSGPFGFGRALLGKCPVRQITDWDAVVLSSKVSLAEAVEVVLARTGNERYDDVLMCGAGQWRRLSAGTVLEEMSRRMAWRASRDDLTGLVNRGTFFERFQALARSRERGSRRIAVIFIDLDGMKSVNDTLGHDAGDALLASVARRLVAAARPEDVVARLGGDEFVVALALPTGDRALPTGDRALPAGEQESATLTRLAERFLTALRQRDPALDPRVTCTVSVGAAMSQETSSWVGMQTLMREADLAMYRAKLAGGDRVVVTADVGTGLEQAPQSVADLSLRQALRDDELEVYYQPIVELAGRRIVSVESLIRWNHPRFGLLGPDWILAAAEAEHALVALDTWVLRQSVRQLLDWTTRFGDRAPSWLNVNVCNASVGDPHLAANVLGVLAELGCPAERLHLELPETASMSLAVSAADQLSALVEAGVRLTIDDMGAGASSLRHLSALAITEMKIDKSFVDRMLTDPRDHAVIEMLIHLAADLGIRVTAEGVETAEQLAHLGTLGVDYVQGYLIARPAPAEVTQRLLEMQPLGVSP